MRLLILGGLGPYPERIQAFRDAGHDIWYAATHYLPAVRDRIPDIPAFPLYERPLDHALDRVTELIAAQRIDRVYSLLNAWDGSNHYTAGLLRRGCPVPIVRHYKEHYLAPSDDERTCIEQSDGVIFINEASRQYFSGIYAQPRSSICVDADLIPARYLVGPLRPKLSARDGRPHLAYLAAGVPVALVDGEMPSLQEHLTHLGAAILYRTIPDLIAQLPEAAAVAAAVLSREQVTFEANFPRLEAFLASAPGTSSPR